MWFPRLQVILWEDVSVGRNHEGTRYWYFIVIGFESKDYFSAIRQILAFWYKDSLVFSIFIPAN